MGHNEMIALIVGSVCVIVFGFILIKKPDILLSMVLRGLLGIVMIHLINLFLLGQNINSGVGINLITIGFSSILGLPGVVCLYAIWFLKAK